jgi:hypothetical protein
MLAVLLACAGTAGAQPAAAASVRLVDDALVFEGRIDARSAAQFLQLLAQSSATRLVITSGGGNVSAALDMAFAVHARGLDVEVPAACHSSCANYIFPSGRRKTLGRIGAVAWHGNMAHVLHLQQTGQANWSEELIADARRLAVREAELFARIGVDGFVCWFGKIAPYAVEDFYALSVADMERFGIGRVSVREAFEGETGDPAVRLLRVDWAGLEAIRPALPPERKE